MVGICSAALNAQDAANRETTKISVASPQLKTVTLTQRFLGQVHAQRHIRIRALQKGYLEASKIKEGQQVKRSDTLFSVIPILYQKRAEAAQAKTMLAQLELQAAERSYANKVVSQYEVRLFEAKLRKVQAEADLAKAELGFATVKAPFDGIIGRPQYQEGSLVLEGDTLATLSDNQRGVGVFPCSRDALSRALTSSAKGGHENRADAGQRQEVRPERQARRDRCRFQQRDRRHRLPRRTFRILT